MSISVSFHRPAFLFLTAEKEKTYQSHSQLDPHPSPPPSHPPGPPPHRQPLPWRAILLTGVIVLILSLVFIIIRKILLPAMEDNSRTTYLSEQDIHNISNSFFLLNEPVECFPDVELWASDIVVAPKSYPPLSSPSLRNIGISCSEEINVPSKTQLNQEITTPLQYTGESVITVTLHGQNHAEDPCTFSSAQFELMEINPQRLTEINYMIPTEIWNYTADPGSFTFQQSFISASDCSGIYSLIMYADDRDKLAQFLLLED